MNTEANQDRIDDLFHQAIALPPDRRHEFLDACNGDADVLAEVRKMIATHELTEDFISPPSDDHRLFPNSTQRQHPLVGQRVGPYEVIRWLGGGGFGHVYLGFRSDDYRQKVAVKVLRSDIEADDRTLARFELERQLLADLQHEHIARLLYGGTLDTGRPYIVMEYVKGKPITDYCDSKRLTVKERLAIFRQVCEAVAYAHRFGAIHRDIKPGNILVTDDGNVKLLDFGIAKMVDPISQRRMVTISEGGMPLTPEYASPEQVRSEGISTASDVYSLGVVLYELLTGRRPYEFRVRTGAECERIICEQEPRKPSTVVLEPVRIRRDDGTDDVRHAQTLADRRSSNPQGLHRLLRGDLEQIVLKTLRKESKDRYGTVEELIVELESYELSKPVKARPLSRRERTARWLKRNRTLAVLSTITASTLVAGTVTTVVFALAAQRSAETALLKERESNRFRAREATTREAVGETFKFIGTFLRTSPDIAKNLDSAKSSLEEKASKQPMQRAHLLRSIAAAQSSLGLLDDAVATLERAKDVCVTHAGKADPYTRETILELANAYSYTGQSVKEIPLREELLDSWRHEFETRVPGFDLLSGGSSYIQYVRRPISPAEIMLADFAMIDISGIRNRCVRADIGQLMHVSGNTSRLAHAYELAGRLDDAASLREKMLAAERKAPRKRTLPELSSLALADVYAKMGRDDEADQIVRAIQADDSKPAAINDSASLDKIAEFRTSPARFLAGQGLFRQALVVAAKSGTATIDELITAALGYDANATPTPLDVLILGELRLVGGDAASAESRIRSAIGKRIVEPFYHKSLGWSLLAQGRIDEAQQAFQEALKECRRDDGTYDLDAADPDEITAAYFLNSVTEPQYLDYFETNTELACFPWFYIAQRREIEGKTEGAVTAYNRCRELGNGDNPHALAALAEWRLMKLKTRR